MRKIQWPKGPCVIACSGGPDSMALLDLANQAGVIGVVAHVNYHKRPDSDRDEWLVRTYCEAHQLPFVCHEQFSYEPGNFQAQARALRYDFFAQCLHTYACTCVLVAHHLDDALETWMMQKQRGQIPETYGLARRVQLSGVPVVRVLLNVRKQTLSDYCEQHRIVYAIDSSNLQDDYTRNKIRHKLETLPDEAYQALIQQMKAQQRTHRQQLRMYDQKAKDLGHPARIAQIYNLSQQERIPVFRRWLQRQKTLGYQGSVAYLEDLLSKLRNRNRKLELPDGRVLLTHNGFVSVVRWPQPIHVVIDQLHYRRYPGFRLARNGPERCGIQLYPEDFPIIVRSVCPGDQIHLSFGKKSVSRWCIDHKLDLRQRAEMIVVENVAGRVIFVSSIGADVQHYNAQPDVYVIK